MRSRRTFSVVALTVVALLPLTAARADVGDPRHYAKELPYGNAASAPVAAPPTGYRLTFLETVARHGSRTMTSKTVEDRAMSVWRGAAAKRKLTTRGHRFDNDVAAFQAVERRLGYGDLSSMGKDELSGIGRRTAESYAGYFQDVASSGDTIAMTTTSVHRTQQSAQYLRAGLAGQVPGLTFAPPQVDDDLAIEEGSTTAGRAAIKVALGRSNVRAAARHLLERLYYPSYVRTLSDPVGKALDVYALYQQAAGMRADTSVTFGTYVPVDDAHDLASAKDAQNFYRFGPGVAGQTSSYQQARPILADFFAQVDARLAGGRTAAVFRNGHGETTMPFAALIGIPGSSQQAPASRTYSWSTNPWRGYVAGRLAGSIEWAVYTRGSDVLVTMRHNEQPIRLGSRCTPSDLGGGYFYPLAELKRCLG